MLCKRMSFSKIKICGLTRSSDVRLALSCGVDYCGFIVFEPSPRGLALTVAAQLAQGVPGGKRVLVDVDSDIDNLKAYAATGCFDYFQLHTRGLPDVERVAAWSEIVGAERLWCAPRLAPEDEFPSDCLEYADTFVMDAYSKDRIGGTGHVGDWGGFKRLRDVYSEQRWVLAGGLNPGNALDAYAASGADVLDFNSGLESEPGLKDPKLVQQLFEVVRGL